MIYFYTTNPCATCESNGFLVQEAKQLGLDITVKFAPQENEDIIKAAKKGIGLPFFTDGEIFAETAQAFVALQKPKGE